MKCMDEEEYLRKYMVIILKKHEKRFNTILMGMADFLRQEVKNFPEDVRVPLYNSMLLMVFVNAISTTLTRIDEDEFDDALKHVFDSIIAACDEIRKRYPL